MQTKVHVDLPGRAYDIHIGPGLIAEDLAEALPYVLTRIIAGAE